jgi:cell division protein FtsN
MSEKQNPGLNTHQSLKIYLIVLGWSALVLFFGIRLGNKYHPEEPPALGTVQLEKELNLRKTQADSPIGLSVAGLDSEEEAIKKGNEKLSPGESSADSILPSSQSTEKAKVSRGNSYTVQVAALRSVAEARSEVKRLLSKGYDARVVEPGLRGRYFKVWVGEFQSEEEIKETETELREAGFSTYVRKTDSSLLQ